MKMTPENEQSSRKKSSPSPAPQFWCPYLLLEPVTFNLKISSLAEMCMELMQEVVNERLRMTTLPSPHRNFSGKNRSAIRISRHKLNILASKVNSQNEISIHQTIYPLSNIKQNMFRFANP
jgi:hypothetical protein